MTSTPAPTTLLAPAHISYITTLSAPSTLEYHLSSHLRLSGLYWGLTFVEKDKSSWTMDI